MDKSASTQRLPSDIKVFKSNNLISGSFRLTVAEQRIVLLCMSKIKHQATIQSVQQEFYEVSAKEYAAYSGINQASAYKEMLAAELRLWKRDLWIKTLHQKERWVSSVRYRQGGISLRFSEAVVPFLCELSSDYSKFRLVAAMRLTSAFGHRLYQILIKTVHTHRFEATFDLETMRREMEIDEGQYPSYTELRRRVIEVAVKDVSQNSDLLITKVTPRKRGKSVVAISIQYTDSNPNFDLAKINHEISVSLGLFDGLEVSKEQGAKILKFHDSKMAKDKERKSISQSAAKIAGEVLETADMFQAEPVKSVNAELLKAVGNSEVLSESTISRFANPGESWEKAEARLIRVLAGLGVVCKKGQRRHS